jgi:hypothetical protein
VIEAVDLNHLWENGYSIAERQGFTESVSYGRPTTNSDYLILWGILSIVEDQVSHGAGLQYLRDRLWAPHWIAIGNLDQRLAILPPTSAKLGRKPSAERDRATNCIDVRIVPVGLFLATAESSSASLAKNRTWR